MSATKQMTEEDVMRKIGALAKHIEVNTNPNEVAVATLKLQKFMLDWNISEAQIAERQNRPAPNIMVADRFAYSTQKSLVNWQVSLLNGVAKAYFGKCVTHPKTPDATIIAEKMNLIAIKAVYIYLRDEILRLEAIAFNQHQWEVRHPQHRRGFSNQFCQGAMGTVYRRIMEQHRKEAATNNSVNALIILKDKLIDEKIQMEIGSTVKRNAPRIAASDAYYKGMKAGQSIPLKPGARQIA